MYRIQAYDDGVFRFALPETGRVGTRVTVVIGPNGSGKSQLLRRLTGHAEVDEIDLLSALEQPPRRTLAISNLVADVFPLQVKAMESYRYLGIRQGTNLATTGALRSLTIEAILMCLLDPLASRGLDYAVEMAGFTRFSISASKTRKRARDRTMPAVLRHLGVADAERVQSQLATLIAGQLPLDDLGAWTALLQHLREFGQTNRLELSDVIGLARRIGSLEPEVSLHRESADSVKIGNLSAGQLLLISLAARVSANVSSGSLILIDEPETGLHPTWQSQIVGLVRSIIPSEYECHVFVATHSPHVVSDADDVLVPGAQWGWFEEYLDPFEGRPVETLLYRVFKARVSGNVAVSQDIETLTAFLGGVREVSPELVRAAVDRLRRIAGDDTPVVNQVLQSVTRELDGL